MAPSWPIATVLSGALALSSSAFVIQLLNEKGELASRFGRATFGILLFQVRPCPHPRGRPPPSSSSTLILNFTLTLTLTQVQLGAVETTDAAARRAFLGALTARAEGHLRLTTYQSTLNI